MRMIVILDIMDKRRNKIFKKKMVIAAVIGSILVATATFGLPRFTAKVEQKCNLCHVSPAGGGMRNAFGSQFFAMTELAVHKTPFEDIERFQPQVSEILSLGADMRTQYIYDESNEMSTFFQMEGNFYLNAQLDPRFSATLKRGLYDGFEIFGMGYILPMKGYFRAGKFQPAYGWRFDDHTSFVRERMLWPANSTDTGIEFGIYPHGISANIGFFNGTGGMFDDGKGKAVSSRFEFRKNIKGVGFGIGGSAFFNDKLSGDIAMFGPFYYLNLAQGKLIYLGEIDWLKDETNESDITSFATTHKISYMFTQGIWLEGQYDFYDPDIDLISGDISRMGIGINYFPYGFLEISPFFRIYDDNFGSEDDYVLFNTQIHFFF